MKVILHHPQRELAVAGPKNVKRLLEELKIPRETVLVIRGEDLLTEDEMLTDGDAVELRPVISGGAR